MVSSCKSASRNHASRIIPVSCADGAPEHSCAHKLTNCGLPGNRLHCILPTDRGFVNSACLWILNNCFASPNVLFACPPVGCTWCTIQSAVDSNKVPDLTFKYTITLLRWPAGGQSQRNSRCANATHKSSCEVLYFICILENIHTRTLCMFGNVYFTLTLQAGRQAGRLYIILLFYIHTLHFLYTHSVFVS